MFKKKEPPGVPEWDPHFKELWHIDLEKEAVNDQRWTCIVTAAIPSEAHDEECIEVFSQFAASGLRRAIKVIKMKDIASFLRKGDVKKEKRKGQKEMQVKNKLENVPGALPRPQILNLAAKYAVFSGDFECKLPPDLMAAVLKHVILNLKSENILQKKKEIAKEKKDREERLKRLFIQSRKTYEMKADGEKADLNRLSPNLEKPINDEPFCGPDLFILLTEFYNPLYFSELVRINVPFVAIIQITSYRDIKETYSSDYKKVEDSKPPNPSIAYFWQTLKKNCLDLESTSRFQNIAMMQYQAPSLKSVESKSLASSLIFDQLSWMQYSAYCVCRQHQAFLQELYVQKTVLSLETLNLSKCELYNKLCDALITGDPNTSWLVLYAIIEQVVAGVPHTESVRLGYEPRETETYISDSDTESLWGVDTTAEFPQRPHKHHKKKKSGDIKEEDHSVPFKNNKSYSEGRLATASLQLCNHSINPSKEYSSRASEILMPEENPMSVELVSKVLSEKKTEKEIRSDKKWKSPKLYFYGDLISLNTYHCDPRLIDSTSIVERFIKTGDLPFLWTKYPVLPPENRAYYNFHFNLFTKMSHPDTQIKLKLYFALCIKFIVISFEDLYKGEEEDLSSVFGEVMKERIKKLSTVHFLNRTQATDPSKISQTFHGYFVKTFITDLFFRTPRKTVIKLDNLERKKASFLKYESSNTHKFSTPYSAPLMNRKNSKINFGLYTKLRENSFVVPTADKTSMVLHSLLDCFEFPTPLETHLSNGNEEFLALIQKYWFFEKLEPRRMVQRLMDVDQIYNTIESLCFSPSDTLIILARNDFDYRGIFSSNSYGVLPTPVTLRDFHHYVYQEIGHWLIKEEERILKILKKFVNKKKEEKDLQDKDYLSKLKKKFCSMSEEERKAFLNSEGRGPQPEAEITEKDLEDLPKKPQFNSCRNKISFVVSNFTNVRVEHSRNVQEYYSRDGTEVSVIINSWLYNPSRQLTLEVRRSTMKLIYHNVLEASEPETTFSLRTASGIIFVFYKNDPEAQQSLSASKIRSDVNYFVKISWPTGLIIEGVPYESSSVYVKQGYIDVYRKGWDIEKETNRCCLRNGQIVIFKESGDVEVLCPSGTKHVLHHSEINKNDKTSSFSLFLPWVSKCEWTTTTGEVWEKVSKGPCQNKKKLLSTHKIYIGVDWRAQEIYYKRDDGVSCMVWTNGKLLTSFPDGTRITSIPDFDKEEVTTEWTEEEKLYFTKSESKAAEPEKSRSRAILRKPNSHMSNVLKSVSSGFQVDGFISISCSYLMEHPKYATVYFDFLHPSAFVKMPEELTIKMSPEGNYEVVQRRKGLRVQDSKVEFYKRCKSCEERSVAVFTPESQNVIFNLTDFALKTFLVQKNGNTMFQENSSSESVSSERRNFECTAHRKFKSARSRASNQRCFALERDLSGYEFVHSNSLATQCLHFPSDTHYDVATPPTSAEEDLPVTHTFSSPYYKVGYENWTMDYEDKESSLPTNLKKKDLTELGVKQSTKKSYKHPPPNPESRREVGNSTLTSEKLNIDMPKVVVTRIVKSFPKPPISIIEDVDRTINAYQKRARDKCIKYAEKGTNNEPNYDSSSAKNESPLTQNLKMYPHLSTCIPSTNREIHHFGHFINLMEIFKSWQGFRCLPDCKQIPMVFPRMNNLELIHEENENFPD